MYVIDPSRPLSFFGLLHVIIAAVSFKFFCFRSVGFDGTAIMKKWIFETCMYVVGLTKTFTKIFYFYSFCTAV